MPPTLAPKAELSLGALLGSRDSEQSPAPRRLYLISGGVPFVICGVTAATNIKNYGPEDEDAA